MTKIKHINIHIRKKLSINQYLNLNPEISPRYSDDVIRRDRSDVTLGGEPRTTEYCSESDLGSLGSFDCV